MAIVMMIAEASLIWSCHILCANAFMSDSMPQQRFVGGGKAMTSFHVERPLAPPFPNGPCGGKVITIPQTDIYPVQKDSDNIPFLLNFNFQDDVHLPPRDIKVWLPKEYHSHKHSHERFPVLYCHDGQNAFEDASSWTGSSFRLVGALTRLHERNMLRTETPPIVVCIPCAEGVFLPGMNRRHMEYGDYNHPVSQTHGQFVASTLHPYITNRFRVKDCPEHISTIGSSLGGQASLQLVLRYPNIFGAAACLSPCFQPATIAAVMASLVLNVFPKGHGKSDTRDLRSKNIYIDNGGDVDDIRVPMFDVHDHLTMNERFWNPGYWWLDTNLQPMIDAMRFIFDQAGVKYTYEKFPGGRHNERAWANRIHRPLLALYGKTSSD